MAYGDRCYRPEPQPHPRPQPGTVLVYRTPQGGQVIAAGQVFQTPVLNVGRYNAIRILANNRSASATNVTFTVTLIQDGERIAQIYTETLAPGANFNELIVVPGTAIVIDAVAATGTRTDVIDLFVYGNRTV